MSARSDASFWSQPAPVWLALGATATAVLVGYAIKLQCAVNPWADNFQYSHLCYNDLQPLFGFRGISRGLLPYRDVQMEYPVLTGMFMHITGVVLRWFGSALNNDRAYFHLSALFLAPFAFMVTMTMRRTVTAARLMLWAAGTPVILYSFHNWDLLAVAGAMWGLTAFERSSDTAGSAAMAVGASAKLYPAFLVPSMVLARFSTGGVRAAARVVIGFLLVYALINVPVIIWSDGLPGWTNDPEAASYASSVQLRKPGVNGWMGVWTFHADRYPDFGTAWYWVSRHGRAILPTIGGGACDLAGKACWWDPGSSGFKDFVSLTSFLLFGAGSGWLLFRGFNRREGGFPVVATGMGIVALFLLTSKVHSPQYALWLTPLLAMLDVPWRRIALYLAGDVGVFVAGFYYFTVMDQPSPGWQGIFEVAVLVRALALLLLVGSSITARRLRPAMDAVGDPATAI